MSRVVVVLLLALLPAAAACGTAAPAARVPRRPRTSAATLPTPAVLARGGMRLVHIPGPTSGFRARPAVVYVPPAAAQSRQRFPVLELLHGEPGGPTDWVTKAGLIGIMRAFAAAHGGRAPVVVMPDVNGSLRDDSECVRSESGADVERYLTVDVPNYLLAHEPVARNRRQWAIAGISEGGMCSAMLALRDYPHFRAFGDISGLARPTVGVHDQPAATIAQIFGGSRSAYDEHDPLWLLARHRYPDLAGWVSCGSVETDIAHAQAQLVSAARRAGVALRSEVIPGRHHSWRFWGSELQRLLAWLWPLLTGEG